MKKWQQLLTISLLTSGGLMVAAVNAQAETKTSNATVEVDQGGALTLDAVPSFNFGKASAQNMLTGVTLPLATTETNQLKVSDSRGLGNNAWSVTASLSTPFTSTDGAELSGAKLNLAAVSGKNSLDAETNYTQVEGATLEGTTEQPIVLKDDAFAGTSTYNYTATSATDGKPSASLILPASATFKSGTYTSEITWTLTSAQ